MAEIKPSALEKLKMQQASITARIQQMEARSKAAERKQDMRRKILVGAYYLDQAKQNPEVIKTIQSGLADYLTRNSDRRLFNLADIPEEKTRTRKNSPVIAR